MDFLQNVDGSTILSLGLICAAGCGILVILFLGLQVIGTSLGIFGEIFGFFTGILAGGPASWCGCIVLFFGCGFCSVIILGIVRLVQECPSNPVNFCRLLGY